MKHHVVFWDVSDVIGWRDRPVGELEALIKERQIPQVLVDAHVDVPGDSLRAVIEAASEGTMWTHEQPVGDAVLAPGDSFTVWMHNQRRERLPIIITGKVEEET